ncbi:MAG TPA: hypothetical protein VFT32_01635, partial [Candidatus Eisenbacteria bacterium]|nr:hypothetical protein [Candidatus Eisenbacteria bacterium]
MIGREFWAEAVTALAGDDGDAPALLESLTRKQFVAPEASSFEGEAGFAFSHIMVRDAAYESITKD